MVTDESKQKKEFHVLVFLLLIFRKLYVCRALKQTTLETLKEELFNTEVLDLSSIGQWTTENSTDGFILTLNDLKSAAGPGFYLHVSD